MKYYRDIKEPPALKFIDKNNITGYLYTEDQIKQYLCLNNTDHASQISEWPDGISRCANDMKYIEFINISIVPSGFLQYSTFNGEIKFSDNIIKIDYQFLQYCESFNQPIVLPKNCGTIDGFFLAYAYAFNSDITFPEVEFSIGQSTLSNTKNFNKNLDLSNCFSISVGFLSINTKDSVKYDHEIKFSNKLKSIENNFLSGRNEVSTNIDLPESIGTSGYSVSLTNFMYNITDFTGIININCSPDCFDSSSNYILSVNNTSYPTYQHGIKISGTYANEMKQKFPDRTTSPYRKLIIV